jgi:hypothetical protein
MSGAKPIPGGLLAGSLLAGLAVSAYALWFRVDGISSNYWMMNDQIGDWNLVQGSFATLPLTGTAKTGGGTHLGPAYFWWLWLARHGLSPWLGPLPHAAGLAVSFLDALSFGVLLVAIVGLGVPVAGAAAAVLLAATVPYEAALARAGWNPNFALACVDLSLALHLLWRRRPSAPRAAVVAALAWIGVTSHLSALTVALPLFAAMLVGAARTSMHAVARIGLAIALVIVVLQVPWLLAQMSAAESGETAITRSFSALLAQPAAVLSMRGLAFVATETPVLLFQSTPIPPWAAVGALVAALAGVWQGALRRRVDPDVALVVPLSLATATLAYGVLSGNLPTYFLVTLLGVLGLLVGLVFPSCSPRPRVRAAAAWGALALVLAAQPQRWQARKWDHSYPLYAAVVRGAREVAQSGVAVRHVYGPVDGRMPTSAVPLVRWLGGNIDPDAHAVARIGRDGGVTVVDAP